MRRILAVVGLCLASIAGALPPAGARPTDVARAREPTPTPGRIVLHVDEGAEPIVASFDLVMGVRRTKRVAALGVVAVDLPPDADVEAAMDVYRALPGVRSVERSLRRRIAATPNDTFYGSQYHLPAIGAPAAWDITKGSAAGKIAVVDTGVKATHVDLAGKVLAGYNAINGSTDADDDEGHGTLVAGVIAAATNNAQGVAGVTWFDKILPVKALTAEGFGDDVDIADGIAWAADAGARIINLSLGAIGYTKVLDDAVSYARSKGALVVAATGNEGISIPNYPAALPGVLAVGATDEDDELPFWPASGPETFASSSNYGAWIDVTAPGDAILTTAFDPGDGALNQYALFTGTSAAAPVAAGAAALVWAANPSFSANQVAARLRNTADDLGLTGFDRFYGHGRINVHRAVGGSPAAPPAQTEPDGEAGNTSDDGLALDGALLATIYPAGDRDWYDVTVGDGEWMHLVVDPPTEIDPVVEIYGPDGSLVHVEDSTFDGEAEDVKLDVAPGTYSVGVSNWLPNGLHPDVVSSRYEITATTDTGPGAPPVVAPTSLERSFFTWYDAVNSQRRNWLMAANVGAVPAAYSATLAADDMFVDPDLVFTRLLLAGDTDPQVFGGLINGPVEMRWLDGAPLIASQRTLWKPDNFEEIAAIPDDRLTSHAWFTWYDGVNTGGKDWVLASNPGPWSAFVRIEFKGTIVATATLEPGENLIWSDATKIGGPVEITSDNPILASRRTLWNTTNFSEFGGIPDRELSSEYLFPWYDSKVTKGKNWILLSNPNDSPINVRVTIGSPAVVNQTFPINPGQTIFPTFPNVAAGPVRVLGLTGPSLPFVASQRNLFDSNRSFEEVAGVPATSLDTEAYYTWYDAVNTGGKDWVLVANPGGASVQVTIKIDGVTVMNNQTVNAGKIITPSFAGRIGGPVEVTATGPIITSRRTLWKKDFTELIGAPPP